VLANPRALTTVKQTTLAMGAIDPVAAFGHLRNRLPAPAMLFEGALANGETGRGSILAFGCAGQLVASGASVLVTVAQREERFEARHVLDACRFLLQAGRPDRLERDSPLGLFGVAAFEFAGYLERLPQSAPGAGAPPDLRLVVPQAVVNLHAESGTATIVTAEASGFEAQIVAALASARFAPSVDAPVVVLAALPARMPFAAMVARAQEAIRAGDAYQVVLSQGWEAPYASDPLSVYGRLRTINPAPYRFFMQLPEATLFGASPEMLCTLRGTDARVRPLAGTRARPSSPPAEPAVARGLRSDPKERAEHVMLVDLGRNDLGRVCRYGSVRLDTFMDVERFSHVMHLVSDVRGSLRSDADAFDLLAATFPAGTVTGAPKIRAMELIAELEGCRRGYYGGAIIRAGFDGSLDTCLILRSAVMRDGRVQIRAGAGVVADSIAAREHAECVAKARAVAQALGATAFEKIA